MVVALVMTDHEDQLAEVSLDAADGRLVRLTPDIYFDGNQRLSAKLAWTQSVNQFSLWVGMTAANLICRSYQIDCVHLNSKVEAQLRDMVRIEAADYCALDADEADNLLQRNLDYFGRVLRHRMVADCVQRFVGTLRQKRQMSRHEVLEQLQDLGRL